MKRQSRTVRFLASVMNVREARLCVALGADIIDAKDATAGALGALAHDEVRAIRAAVPAGVAVSATIGDPSEDATEVARAARRMAATGVDYVKVGLADGKTSRRSLELLRGVELGGARLVGVLLADRGIDLSLLPDLKAAGFAGAMLDTAEKASGALPDLIAPATLRRFVEAARGAGLFAGFAGSLQARHVRGLVRLDPDLLGFRGGLCCDRDRACGIDEEAVRGVRRAIDAALATRREPERVP